MAYVLYFGFILAAAAWLVVRNMRHHASQPDWPAFRFPASETLPPGIDDMRGRRKAVVVPLRPASLMDQNDQAWLQSGRGSWFGRTRRLAELQAENTRLRQRLLELRIQNIQLEQATSGYNAPRQTCAGR